MTSNNTDWTKAVILCAFIRTLILDKASRNMKFPPNLLVYNKYTPIVGHSHSSGGCFSTPL